MCLDKYALSVSIIQNAVPSNFNFVFVKDFMFYLNTVCYC